MKNKALNKIFVLIFLLTTILLINACKSTVTSPTPLPAGSRNYTWIIDTFKVPPDHPLTPSRLWGTSANDLWAVGYAYSSVHTIWHYDGKSWKTDSIFRKIDPDAIWGSAKDDFWIGSIDGSFWHHNGVQLSKFCDTKIENYGPFINQGICGSSNKDIYAVGYADSSDKKSYKGIIMHYDGVKWAQVPIRSKKESFFQIFYSQGTNEFLICSWIFDKPDCYVYSFNGKELTEIFHSENGGLLCKIGGNIYFSLKDKLFRIAASKMNLFRDFQDREYLGNAWGRNENDFFGISNEGLAHYNGTDLMVLVKKWNYDLIFLSGIVFEKDVFFLWKDTMTGYMISIHGVLNN